MTRLTSGSFLSQFCLVQNIITWWVKCNLFQPLIMTKLVYVQKPIISLYEVFWWLQFFSINLQLTQSHCYFWSFHYQGLLISRDNVQWPICANFVADRHKIFASFEYVKWLFSGIICWHWKQISLLNLVPEELRSGVMKSGFKDFSSFTYSVGIKASVYSSSGSTHKSSFQLFFLFMKCPWV